METGDRLGVVLRPGDGVDPPGLVVAGLRRVQRGRGVGEPLAVGAQRQPLGELGPGLGAELALGVGGDDAARVRQRRQRPQDDPGDQRRLADAVARGDGHPHRLVGRHQALVQSLAELLQDVALPRLGAAVVGQHRARLSPGEGEVDVAHRIEAVAADLLAQGLFGRGGGLGRLRAVSRAAFRANFRAWAARALTRRHGAPHGSAIERRRQIVGGLELRRRLGPRLPVLALAVAQPEHAGLGVGRIGHGVGDRLLVAAIVRGAGDLVAEPLGALEQGTDDHAIGDGAAAIHRVGEVGVGGDPVVDGAGGNAEEAG